MQFKQLFLGTILTIAAIASTQSIALSNSTRPGAVASAVSLSMKQTRFTVRLENISTKDEFTASNGTKWTLDYSPGEWLVSNSNSPLFTVGQKDRAQGIEAIAEDGNPSNLAKSLQNLSGVQSSGIFNTPVGANKMGGIRPGQAFEFTVTAAPGQKLSLVTMFGQSNDWFYAPQSGIDLFDSDGQPLRGDVTARIGLWNAGTEVDEEPGIGSNQGPRQKAPNTGVDENGVVQAVADGAPYTQTSRLLRVMITPER